MSHPLQMDINLGEDMQAQMKQQSLEQEVACLSRRRMKKLQSLSSCYMENILKDEAMGGSC